MTLSEIKKALTSLNPHELDDLLRAITALRQLGHSHIASINEPPINPEKEMMLRILHDALEAIGCPAPYQVLRNAAKGSEFTMKMSVLIKFCDGLTKQERYAVLKVGTTLMVNDLQQIGVTITPGSAIRCIHRIPAAINRAFPNYARYGLLKVIAGSLVVV
jgi:hypothetical protein